jgi:hypothetical protein
MEWMMMIVVGLLQARPPAGGGGGGGGGPFGPGVDLGGQILIQLVAQVIGSLISGACWWGAFAKAGQPAWAGFIPIYREIIQCQIADKPVWWAILLVFGELLCAPLFLVMALLLYIEIANRFGQGAGFAIGMLCCGIIFIPILSYGSSEYMGGRRRRRRDDDDEDDEDDRPRRRRARDEDEDEDEDRPRRRPRDDDDDEGEERVRRRPRDD